MNSHNAFKVNGIIQYLQANDLFDLDWMDLHEMSNEDILKHFDLAGLALTKLEKYEFIIEVTRQAQAIQTAEIVRSTLDA